MMNEYEIRSLLKSEEINKVWMEIQQALPHLAFCLHLSEERTDACVDFLYDNISTCSEILKQYACPSIEANDLIRILSDSRKSFIDFCRETLLYRDKIEFNTSDLPYTLEELDMTEDELKQLYEKADYDCSYIISELIEFHIITKHQSLLTEYYKEQGLIDFEKQGMDILKIYSSLE